MIAHTRRALFLAGVLVGMTGTIDAQIDKKAQVGFRFLENPVSAEAVGRGGIGVAVPSNALSVFWNPALISWELQPVDLGLHFTSGIADINTNAAAAVIKIESFGTVGLSLISMDYGEFYGTRRSTNSEGYEETGTFSPKAYAIGISFSQRVSNRFSYGVQVKRATQDLGSAWVAPTGTSIDDPGLATSMRGYVRSRIAIDVGAFYDFGYNGVRFGATLQNISQEVRFENEDVPLPFAVSFGVSVEPLAFFTEESDRSLILSFESRHPRDFREKFKMGVEYAIQDVVILRTGFATNYSERNVTMGLGIRHTLEGFPLRLDYAYQPFGVFGIVHHLSLGVAY